MEINEKVAELFEEQGKVVEEEEEVKEDSEKDPTIYKSVGCTFQGGKGNRYLFDAHILVYPSHPGGSDFSFHIFDTSGEGKRVWQGNFDDLINKLLESKPKIACLSELAGE